MLSRYRCVRPTAEDERSLEKEETVCRWENVAPPWPTITDTFGAETFLLLSRRDSDPFWSDLRYGDCEMRERTPSLAVSFSVSTWPDNFSSSERSSSHTACNKYGSQLNSDDDLFPGERPAFSDYLILSRLCTRICYKELTRSSVYYECPFITLISTWQLSEKSILKRNAQRDNTQTCFNDSISEWSSIKSISSDHFLFIIGPVQLWMIRPLCRGTKSFPQAPNRHATHNHCNFGHGPA